MTTELTHKMTNAAKWSVLTELLAKMITPVSAMVLARLLTPEAYGVVATITMVTSFAEIFADAGFQKYMVQHEFVDDLEKNECANVAFWSNVIISISLWALIVIFRNIIAALVGNPGLGNALAIAGISIPLISISSLQMALFRRDFDYKTLFQIRLCTILVPFIITIPIAFVTRSYWALIVGTIVTNLTNTILLSKRAKWSPKRKFDKNWFLKMFSFSMWTLLEHISIWLSGNIDIFIVGSLLSASYLGMYKTAMTTSTMILAIITGATTSILFSALSRLQNDISEFRKVFLQFQRIISLLILPMGVGIYIYREFVTFILLGKQWMDVADFLGMYALLGAFSTVLSHYCSEIYRSLGKPKVSFTVQIIYILGLIPIIYWGASQTFEMLTISRSFMRLYMIVVHAIFMWKLLRMSMWQFVKNISPSIISAFLMGIFGTWINTLYDHILWNVICIGLCIVFYFMVIWIFLPNLRKEGVNFLQKNIGK